VQVTLAKFRESKLNSFLIKVSFVFVLVTDTTNNSGILIAKLPHSESFPPGVSSSSTNVFINAPFKPKTTNKQRSSAAANPASPILSLNKSQINNKKHMMTDIETQQLGYSNLSFDETVVDEYF
jgi:hypothetical protein